MEAESILLVALLVHITLASLVRELLAVKSMNVTTVNAAAMAHAQTQSVHSLAHAMMVSMETDLTALILMNVQPILITVMTMLPVKTKSDDSLADATTDTLVMELTAMMSTNVTLVLMNVTMTPLVLTMLEAMTAHVTPVTLVMADNVLTLMSETSLEHVMPMLLVKTLSVASSVLVNLVTPWLMVLLTLHQATVKISMNAWLQINVMNTQPVTTLLVLTHALA